MQESEGALLQHGVRHIRVEGKAPEPKLRKLQRLVRCDSLAGKNLGVQLVKNNDREFRHQRPKRFDRGLGRLVEIDIEIQQ